MNSHESKTLWVLWGGAWVKKNQFSNFVARTDAVKKEWGKKEKKEFSWRKGKGADDIIEGGGKA